MAKKAKRKVKAGASKAEAAQKRALFIKAMVANGGNATQAAITAGFSAKTARQAGSRLLTHVDVKAAIARTRGAALTAADLTIERTLREVARLAFFDPRKLYDEEGKLKAVHELDDDTAAALAGVEVDEIGVEGVVIGQTKKLKHCDKNAALEKAMKHLGQYSKDNGQIGKAIGRAIIVPAKQASG
jgi:phage terminase small subunit